MLMRSYDAAAEAVSKALVEDPDNNDAILVAAEIEAARGNHQQAIELAHQNPRAPFGCLLVDRSSGQVVAAGINQSSINESASQYGVICRS